VNLFLEYFIQDSSANTTCLVIDGIDEAEPQEQDLLLNFLEKAFSEGNLIGKTASLRIVLLSRDSMRCLLEEHSLDGVPEIEVGNVQNKDDLHQYISQKLQKTKLFRGYTGFLEEIILDISQKAEDLWEWANLVIRSVLRCRSKEQIRRVIKKMPHGISAMLQHELQRLSTELSGHEELSDDLALDGDGLATQIEQLNVLLTFVALAQKPLTMRQLSIILEVLLEEEYMSLEDDLRTLYSSLFYVRESDAPDLEDELVVTLRHSSFYEFFQTAGKSGLIHVDLDLAEVRFSFVCLHALDNSCTPLSERSTDALWRYAQDFLPFHLGRSDSEKAGNLRNGISSFFVNMFSNAKDREWLIYEVDLFEYGSHASYPMCYLTDLGSYWLDAGDYAIVDKRAETILQWLLPDAKQKFVSYARVAAMASDTCAFTILWSFTAVYWTQRWLQPEQISEDDGLAAIVPAILAVYDSMANGRKISAGEQVISTQERPENGLIVKASDELYDFDMPTKILVLAKLRQLDQTRMWHARVAQALLARNGSGHAIEHFQVSLREEQIGPGFSSQSLSVIHKDMSRAYTKLAMHKEALEHLEIYESLRNTSSVIDDEQNYDSTEDRIRDMLNKAQKKHNAKLTNDAIATIEEAWNLLFETQGTGETDALLSSFFEIYLEVNELHRLRSAFDFAFIYFKDAAEAGTKTGYLGVENFIAHRFIQRPHVMYRVLHCAINQNDQVYLDIAARALREIDNIDVAEAPMKAKYLLSTALFEKGHTDAGILGWHDVASRSTVSSDLHDKAPQIRSICKLATLCLKNERPLCWKWPPLTLDKAFELGDVCLLLSTWFTDRGDYASARDTLRWRVKESLALLSDDDPSNDTHAFMGLFKVFLLAKDSDEDLEAAWYMIKHDTEPRMLVSRNRMAATIEHDSFSQGGLPDKLETLQLTGNQVQPLGDDEDNSWIDDIFFADIVSDPLSECSSCKREIPTLHHGWFCRSCAFSTLCQRCYRLFESGNHYPFANICNSEHQFYFTGSLLRPSERVPEGMVPLIPAAGEKQVIWVEEWKDRLAEKWKTTELTFPKGGFLAWCMHVLPEPQKTRWATLFQI
jgi:hypothetical protein